MKMICSECGSVNSGKPVAKGSTGVEIVLWLLFIIPGLIYSIWRLSSYHKTCKSCGSPKLIPLDSPVGKKLLEQQGKTVEEVMAKSIKKPPMPKVVKILIGCIVAVAVIILGAVILAMLFSAL